MKDKLKELTDAEIVEMIPDKDAPEALRKGGEKAYKADSYTPPQEVDPVVGLEIAVRRGSRTGLLKDGSSKSGEKKEK